MNVLYRLMDKLGLKTPPAYVHEEDAATTWGDCQRCGKEGSGAECNCLWLCRHRGCEGVGLSLVSRRN